MNANSVSAKNKVVNRAVAAVNRVDSKADDKPVILKRKRREATPAALFFSSYENQPLPLFTGSVVIGLCEVS